MKIRMTDPLTGLPLQALRFMAEGDGAGGGGGTGGGAGGGTGDGGQGGSGGQGGGSGSGDKTFTQDDVERMISDRLARERSKTADYDQLKEKAGKWDKHEADSASELEKATKKAADEAAEAARAEVRVERVLDKIEVAAAGKFADPEDAQLHLGKRAQEFIGKDGSIDTKAIAAAVEQLLKDKPHLAAKTTTPDPADAGRAGLGGQGGSGGGSGDGATVQPGLGRLQHAYANSGKTGSK
jgi:hypothetical protein